MAKIEPFPFAILLPDSDSGEEAGLSLSVAAAVEEPDLRRGADLVHTWGGLAETGFLSLASFSDQDRLIRGDEPAILVATTSSTSCIEVAIYCRFPVALISDLAAKGPAHEFADANPSDSGVYADVARLSDCIPDPLVVAMTGLEVDAVSGLIELGRPIAQYASPGEGVITLREVTDKKQREKIEKLLVPGWLGAAKPTFILDGPFTYCATRAKAGDSHVFACVIPVGDGLATLQQRELLIEKLVGRLDGFSGGVVETDDDLDAGEELSSLTSDQLSSTIGESSSEPSTDAQLPAKRLPDVKNILRRYHDGTPRGMNYAREDWEEDQRLEAVVSDACAMLVRGLDEYLLAVGGSNQWPLAVGAMYPESALIQNAIRRSLGGPGGAVNAFTRGVGHIAMWPFHLSAQEATSRILQRRPPVAWRRALVAHSLPIRGATVVMLSRA